MINQMFFKAKNAFNASRSAPSSLRLPLLFRVAALAAATNLITGCVQYPATSGSISYWTYTIPPAGYQPVRPYSYYPVVPPRPYYRFGPPQGSFYPPFRPWNAPTYNIYRFEDRDDYRHHGWNAGNGWHHGGGNGGGGSGWHHHHPH